MIAPVLALCTILLTNGGPEPVATHYEPPAPWVIVALDYQPKGKPIWGPTLETRWEVPHLVFRMQAPASSREPAPVLPSFCVPVDGETPPRTKDGS